MINSPQWTINRKKKKKKKNEKEPTEGIQEGQWRTRPQEKTKTLQLPSSFCKGEKRGKPAGEEKVLES